MLRSFTLPTQLPRAASAIAPTTPPPHSHLAHSEPAHSRSRTRSLESMSTSHYTMRLQLHDIPNHADQTPKVHDRAAPLAGRGGAGRRSLHSPTPPRARDRAHAPRVRGPTAPTTWARALRQRR